MEMKVKDLYLEDRVEGREGQQLHRGMHIWILKNHSINF